MPASLWSGNLRLSLVLIPVRLHSATTEGNVALRMIHAPSGQPSATSKAEPNHTDYWEHCRILPKDTLAFETKRGTPL